MVRYFLKGVFQKFVFILINISYPYIDIFIFVKKNECTHSTRVFREYPSEAHQGDNANPA